MLINSLANSCSRPQINIHEILLNLLNLVCNNSCDVTDQWKVVDVNKAMKSIMGGAILKNHEKNMGSDRFNLPDLACIIQ